MTKNEKSARTARRVGLLGAIFLIVLGAWASYVIKGRVMPSIVALAAFTGMFHYLGCSLFVKHFKALDIVEQAAGQASADSVAEGELK